MSTSFPYLKIARDYDVPYGKVIRFAEAFDDKRKLHEGDPGISYAFPPANSFHPNDAVSCAIYIAVINEAERRAGAST